MFPHDEGSFAIFQSAYINVKKKEFVFYVHSKEKLI